MNGAADLGGMMGFGPVAAEPDEPLFHAEWERRAFALVLAMGATGSWTLDESRFARESLPPAEYLSSSYYRIWLAGLEKLLVENGLATAAELAEGAPREPARALPRVLAAADVDAVLARGAPVDRPARSDPLFAPGDRVRTINMHPRSHTRLPRYLRGRLGTVVAVHGVHVFPDANASGGGEDPQWLYGVRFASRELWGRDGNDRDSVTADCWEPYLEPA